MLVFGDHSLRLLCAFINYLLYFSVDSCLNLLSIWFCVLRIRISNIPKFLVHAKFSDESIGQIVSLFEVVIGTRCHLLEEVQLGASTTQDEANTIEKFLLRLELVFVDEVLCKSKGSLRSGNNCHFEQRVSALQKPRNNSMATLVKGNSSLFFHRNETLTLDSTNHPLRGKLEIHHFNDILSATSSQNCCLITKIGQFCTTKAGS